MYYVLQMWPELIGFCTWEYILISTQSTMHSFLEDHQRANYSLKKSIGTSYYSCTLKFLYWIACTHISLLCIMLEIQIDCDAFQQLIMTKNSLGISLPWGKRRWNPFHSNITLRFVLLLTIFSSWVLSQEIMPAL